MLYNHLLPGFKQRNQKNRACWRPEAQREARVPGKVKGRASKQTSARVLVWKASRALLNQMKRERFGSSFLLRTNWKEATLAVSKQIRRKLGTKKVVSEGKKRMGAPWLLSDRNKPQELSVPLCFNLAQESYHSLLNSEDSVANGRAEHWALHLMVQVRASSSLSRAVFTQWGPIIRVKWGLSRNRLTLKPENIFNKASQEMTHLIISKFLKHQRKVSGGTFLCIL